VGTLTRTWDLIQESVEILLADKNALINSLRHEDTPMHFYTKLEDFPGYIGAGPRKRWISPSPAVRADH